MASFWQKLRSRTFRFDWSETPIGWIVYKSKQKKWLSAPLPTISSQSSKANFSHFLFILIVQILRDVKLKIKSNKETKETIMFSPIIIRTRIWSFSLSLSFVWKMNSIVFLSSVTITACSWNCNMSSASMQKYSPNY